MPLYSTVSSVLLSLPVVMSRSNISSADIAAFIDRGESIINAKLSKLYVLPFSQPPPLLTHISADLGVYFMLRRFFTQEKSNDSPWIDRYRESMELLDQIASGEVPLVDASGGVIEGSSMVIEIWSNNLGYQPTMSEDNPIYHRTDRQKISDIRSDRGQGDDEWAWG